MSVYADLKEKFILPNAFDDWREFRTRLTDSVIRHKDCKAESLAVIGAGRCNDIDLERLWPGFQKITLIDIDAEAMEEAVKRLPTAGISRVEILPLSLTGIGEKDFTQCCDSIYFAVRSAGRRLTTEKYDEIIRREIESLEMMLISSEDLASRLPACDMILYNGVCSQLFSILSFFLRSITASVEEALEIDA